MAEHTIFKTLRFKRLGTPSCGFEGLDDFLREKNIPFYGSTGNLKPKGPLTSKGETSLVVTTVAELGLNNVCCYADILKAAERTGLKPCRPAVGPQLLFDYPDQPDGEFLIIATQPEDMGWRTGDTLWATYALGKAAINFNPVHQYLEAQLMHPPEETGNYAEVYWVFELK